MIFNNPYKILKAETTYDTLNGKSITTDRLAFHRGDSVAIILHGNDSDSNSAYQIS